MKVTVTQIENVIISSSFSAYPLQGAGGQVTHDGAAFPWGSSLFLHVDKSCSATAQILP